MGNLEKAGVLVVVALLAVILVVAFLNFPDQGKAPVLNATTKVAQVPEVKKAPPKNEPANLYPDPDLIRPNDSDRPSTETPPRMSDTPVTFVQTPPVVVKRDDVINPIPISVPKDPPREEKPAAPTSPWPKTVKVLSGDSLWSIAVREYGAKTGPRMLGAIADANPKVRPEAMKAGTELKLPAPPAEAAVSAKAGAEDAKAPGKTSGKTAAKEPAKDPAKEPAKSSRKLPFVPE